MATKTQFNIATQPTLKQSGTKTNNLAAKTRGAHDNGSRYLNNIRTLDDALGVFIDGLKERSLLETSIVVVQGDHGPRLNNLGLWQDLNERDLHTPALIRFPSSVGLNLSLPEDRVATSIDILPTIMDAMGADVRTRSTSYRLSFLKLNKLFANFCRKRFGINILDRVFFALKRRGILYVVLI